MSDTPIFSEDELKTLISALLEGQERSCTEGEILMFVDWCESIRIRQALLGLLLKGKLLARWDPRQDDWVFKNR